MNDNMKTKAQLIEELAKLRRLVDDNLSAPAELELNNDEKKINIGKQQCYDLVDMCPDPIVVIQDEKYTYANRAFYETFKYSSKDIARGLNLLDLVPKPDQQKVRKRNKDRLAGKPLSKTLRIDLLSKDGNLIACETSSHKIEFDNRPASIVIMRDISERLQIENELWAQLKFRELVEGFSKDFINLPSDEIDDGINRAIKRVGEFAGVDRCYLFKFRDGNTRMDNTHEWCRKGIKPSIDRLQDLLTKDFYSSREYLVKGEIAYVPNVAELPQEAEMDRREFEAEGIRSLIAIPIKYGDSLIGFYGLDSVRTARSWTDNDRSLLNVLGEIFANALDRQRVESELKSREEKYRILFHASPESITLVGLDGTILDCNETTVRLNGRSREEIIGKNYLELQALNPSDVEQTGRVLVRLLAGEKVEPFELEVVRIDGEKRQLEVFPIPLFRDGEAEAIQVIARDITIRKMAEKERAELQKELYQAQKMEAIGTLAGGIAHDFNNILTGISGYSELLLYDLEPGSPAEKKAQEILVAAEHATSLTQQLLTFSSRQQVQPKVIDLNNALSGAKKMLRHLLKEDIKIELKLSEQQALIRIDPGQLNQVLVNLISNAKDAMPNGGKLVVEVLPVTGEQDQEDSILLRVADDGCGMPESTRIRIFEPFFTTKGRATHSGLGMSTVYGIIRQSGGSIEAVSRPEQGTEILISMPSSNEKPEKQNEDDPTWLEGSETILLVEDDPMIRKLAKGILVKSGYNVFEASGGKEALTIFEKASGKIDLLLTDVVMPDMNGKDLSDKLAALAPDLKIVFTSGYSEDILSQYNFVGHEVHFVQKPFRVTALVSKIRQVLDLAN